MSDRWQLVERIYHSALERKEDERTAYLKGVCAGDDALLHEVESLLLNEKGAESLLNAPAVEIAARMFDKSSGQSMMGRQMGSYHVVSLLGAGGMGEVYQAHDTKLRRDVAIKILPPEFLHDAGRLARFQREARMLASLNHPNIATIHGLEDSNGISYLVMELVPGETLAQRIKRDGAIPVEEALTIAKQIAEGLEAAHEKGIIHRDLKPANIAVTPEGRVKVLDFGLAKAYAAETEEDDFNGPTLSAHTMPGAIMGTPAYMSPEQARGGRVDGRTDIWAFGCVLYEMLTAKRAFFGETAQDQIAGVLTREIDWQVLPPATPGKIRDLLRGCLQKDSQDRLQDFTAVKKELEKASHRSVVIRPRHVVTAAAAIVLVSVLGGWLYRQSERRQWAREEAIPEITRLAGEKKPLAAFLVLRQAEQYQPGNPQLMQIDRNSTRNISVQSTPPGAKVEIQDYSSPNGGKWFSLGTTPLEHARIPNGYFRWRISKPGAEELVAAPFTTDAVQFSLQPAGTQTGMVPVPGGHWVNLIGFIGWLHYELPPFDIDRFEVTNRRYQEFVDQGGYTKREYWKEPFIKDGKELTWEQAMALLRDPTGRPGPSTWKGGHFPSGEDNYPVSGVSWYEAAAYAAFAGKSLPAIGQWYKTAPVASAEFSIAASNFGGEGPIAVGTSRAVGPYGTYDMTGNVREWSLTAVDADRFILGGAWRTQIYQAYYPEALPPFDRSAMNGFRCVLNKEPLSAKAAAPVIRNARDFSKAKPVSDEVFQVYQDQYAYDRRPLNSQPDGAVEETADWTKQRITMDAGYENERVPVYLFLPKSVRPPFQAVVFFPSARVNSLPDSHNLGDMSFIDYVIQSGRALIYPIYKGTYERRVLNQAPPGSVGLVQVVIQESKEVRRAVDYLETRSDIEKNKLAYLGVSQGSAYGVIFTALEDRFKAVIFLDGGFFQQSPLPGQDQVNFAPRLKKPLLMVNGQYDFTFPPDLAQLPLVKMIGTPEADKRRVVSPTAHDVSQDSALLSKEVLAWLDKYLGRVN
jgi:serine/threonine protein kinase/predicted esterase